jgi:hypothetical protein
VTSESNCAAPAEKALPVFAGVEDDLPAGDEQRAGLDEIAGRLGRSGASLDQPDVAAVDHDAAAVRRIRRRDRLVPRRPAVDPQLTERAVGVAEKEAAHDGFLDAVPPAPPVQVLGAGEVDDTCAHGAPRM